MPSLLSSSRSVPLCLVLVLLAGALGVGVAMPPAAAADGRLSGRVFDTGAAPLAEATVRATDQASGTTVQTKTDTNGRYALTVPDGAWDLGLSGTTRNRPVEARVNNVRVIGETTRDIMVAAPGIEFSGTVRDSTGGVVQGAFVIFDDYGAPADAEGRFSFTTQPGTHRLKISGYDISASVENFRLDETTNRDFVLPVVPVEVTVRDGDGRPVPGLHVGISSAEGPAPFELIPGKPTVASNSHERVTDAAGRARVMAVPTATDLYVHARSSTEEAYVARTVGALDAPLAVDLTWSLVRLSGTVRDTAGEVPPEALVVLTSDGPTGGGSHAIVKEDGTFSLTAPPGRYRLDVTGRQYDWTDDEDGSDHNGYRFTATADELALEANRSVDLRLPVFEPVTVHVTDSDGAPTSASVDARSGSPQRSGGSAVELLPGAAGSAWVDSIWDADTDGIAVVRSVPGAEMSLRANRYDAGEGTYEGPVPATGSIAVRLSNAGSISAGDFPVRLINAQDPSQCAYIEVNGPDGYEGHPSGDTCTLGLQPGEYHLSIANEEWGDSGDYTREWYWLDADYTVTGPATLSLVAYPAERAQVDVVDSDGNPILSSLVLEGAPGTIDLATGIKARAQVANYYESADDGPTFHPPMFEPTVFSGEFQPDGGERITFTGLKLTAGRPVTLVHPGDLPNVAYPDDPPNPTTTTTTPTTTEPATGTPTDPPANTATTGTSESGYWALAADGHVYNFGDAAHLGDTTTGAVDLEPRPTGKGYWALNKDGLVQGFGDAPELGNVDLRALASGEQPASLSATPSGMGYWVFTNKGRAVAFGDAPFLGDMRQTKLNGPVLGSVATPSGRGYYMVASDGGIFAFGDAGFAGSMGGKPLNQPVQSLVPDADGKGYWLVASDGGVFAFDAPFRGSMGGTKLNMPVVGMVRYGDGYLMVGADGGIFNFSTAPFAGSLGDKPPASPVVAVAALP